MLLIFNTVIVQEITLGHKISLACNYPRQKRFLFINKLSAYLIITYHIKNFIMEKSHQNGCK